MCVARFIRQQPNPMLLQKTLHMNQSLEECKTRLASIQSYRRQFVMVTKATVTSSKTVDFSFRGPLGFEARTVLLSVESESPDQMAFESTGGNLDVMGLAEFTEIRFLTGDYLRFKYGDRVPDLLLRAVCWRGLRDVAAPSVYAIARRPTEQTSGPLAD